MTGQQITRRTTNIESAARQYGIGRSTAYQLARENKLPGAIRLGNRIVVSQEVIDKVLSDGR